LQGKFEDVNAESKKIFQIDTFEGARVEYQRGLNNSFGVSHVAHLGGSPDSPATYEFCANFSQDKVDSHTVENYLRSLKFPDSPRFQHLLLSRTSPSNGDNTVLAQYIFSATPNLMMRIQSQVNFQIYFMSASSLVFSFMKDTSCLVFPFFAVVEGPTSEQCSRPGRLQGL
jgi:hypothetical protein